MEDGGASQNNLQSVICIPVSIDRLEQQWFQFATKSNGRAQQLQFYWQPVLWSMLCYYCIFSDCSFLGEHTETHV